ncbi:MAG: type II secretion system F family protein [Proteobacteria bacterium]|nr:type II secretion system F family protein [Pseudomonadota bacterium]
MPVFAWEGRTRQGQLKKGVVEASTEAAAMMQLRAQSIIPVSVKPKAARSGGGFKLFKKGVKTRELVVFTRQFATMIDAGLPLVQCLEIQSEQQENKSFGETLGRVKSDVEQGSTFAESLAKHPRVFDELYVNLVTAGEIGGVLDTILNRLSAYLEKADSLKRKVKSAMVYPTTVMVVAMGVLALLLVKVIPVFEKMFKDFGGELPAPTQMVIHLSNWMQQWILLILASVVAVAIAYVQARRRSPRFRYQTDAIFLKLPLFGALLRKVAVARFSRTFSTMLSSGVPILDALDICAKTSGNKVIEAGLQKVRAAISEGKTIAEPLKAVGVFPGMVVQMIAVGEQTGAMDSMLAKLADFYDDEVDAAVDGLTSMLEPLMMVFLGGSIGSILIAMYLPIFKIAEVVK